MLSTDILLCPLKTSQLCALKFPQCDVVLYRWVSSSRCFEVMFISVNPATDCNILEDQYPHFLICSKQRLNIVLKNSIRQNERSYSLISLYAVMAYRGTTLLLLYTCRLPVYNFFKLKYVSIITTLGILDLKSVCHRFGNLWPLWWRIVVGFMYY